jgi:hypothetical protein
MIRIVVSILVAAVSAFAILAATLNSFMYGLERETLAVGSAYVGFLALGLWSARGSHAGTLVLAGCLVITGVALLVATMGEPALPPTMVTISHHPPTRWRVPVVLLILGGGLVLDRCMARKNAIEAAEQ